MVSPSPLLTQFPQSKRTIRPKTTKGKFLSQYQLHGAERREKKAETAKERFGQLKGRPKTSSALYFALFTNTKAAFLY